MPRVGPCSYRIAAAATRLGAYPFPTNTRCSSLAARGGGGGARLRSVSVENSRVVGPLRVATACYNRVQRTLLSLRVSAPKGLRHAFVGCLPPCSTDRLLLRTSENFPFPRT